MSAPELMAFACKHISERPAFPKRIEILSTISLTAVGKVYKPELWILACTHVLRERLARTGLRDCLTVTVQDSAQGIVANFVGDKGFDPSEYPSQVSDLMRSFAIEYIIALPKSGKQEPTP